MNWIQSLTKAIDYIENHLTESVSIDDISKNAYTSSSHFQLIFHVISGMTVGEYIRNRRLSMAALELLKADVKIIDVAMRYDYDTQEGFSKAFTRFHGVSPSKIDKKNVKIFHPLKINVTVQGGFDMSFKLLEEFYWREAEDSNGERSDVEKYNQIVSWAAQARRVNPSVFDALTEWLLDDSKWHEGALIENEQILLQGVFARFKEQNTELRKQLKAMEASGVVNDAVYKALDHFDDELIGKTQDPRLKQVVSQMFEDFSIMKHHDIRLQIAGNKTGLSGTDTVDYFGYINCLKDCDASVQWALFMPDMVKKQQRGFKIDNFEYLKFDDMRFIGKLWRKDNQYVLKKHIFDTLDEMSDYNSEFTYDILLGHHNGRGVDIEPWCGVWGRFMRKNTPVPEGFISFDFVSKSNGEEGFPFISQFALARFSGDIEAMHQEEGYDAHAMYDVTRNIILGQGVLIPYPHKYWTADVFLEGYMEPSTAYIFGVDLV